MDESTSQYAVLVPIHRINESVYECLDSIISDVPNEVVIYCVLHNPTQDLRNFLADYPNLMRITVFEKIAPTLSGVLNFALESIPEPWVFRMDSDDLWLKGRFSKQISFLKMRPDAWAIGGALEVFDRINGKTYSIYENEACEVSRKTLLEGCLIPNPTTLFNRKKVLSIGGYNIAYEAAEDYELWSRVVFLGRINRQNETLVKDFIHSESQSIAKKEIQAIETRHIKFNMAMMDLRIPPCKLSHAVGTSLYCHTLEMFQIFCERFFGDSNKLSRKVSS